MNILYIGYSGTSGYAISARNYIFNYLCEKQNVTFISKYVDNSVHDNDIIHRCIVENCSRYFDEYDFFIANCIPSEYNEQLNLYKHLLKPKTKRILQTVWETTKIPTEWVNFLNDSNIDEIWVPSEFNKKSFLNNGVINLIKVNKYLSFNIFRKKEKTEIEIPNNIQFGNKDIKKTLNFYFISTWNERKNNINTIKTFCETFSNNDNVSLMIKTNYNQYDECNYNKINKEIVDLLSEYKNHPNIVWFPYNYNLQQINDIHNLGDCYYLLHRGEGLGYSSYDAYLNNKPVIVTGFGGHREYFCDNYPYYVDYKLIPVRNMEWTTFYNHEHEWADPDYEHAKILLRSIYSK